MLPLPLAACSNGSGAPRPSVTRSAEIVSIRGWRRREEGVKVSWRKREHHYRDQTARTMSSDQAPSGISGGGPTAITPTLLIKMSIRSKVSIATAKALAMSSSFVTSQDSPTDSPLAPQFPPPQQPPKSPAER